MAQTLINIRMDEELKRNMEQTCQELGMNMTTAITIFAKKMTREKRIPFDVSIDPFYSESNMAHLRRGMEALNEGKGVEHDLNNQFFLPTVKGRIAFSARLLEIWQAGSLR